MVGDLGLPQRRSGLALRTLGPRPDVFRSGFGSGVPSPSEDGGVPELFDVIPSRTSSSAIRARACASNAFNFAFSAISSSYESTGPMPQHVRS